MQCDTALSENVHLEEARKVAILAFLVGSLYKPISTQKKIDLSNNDTMIC